MAYKQHLKKSKIKKSHYIVRPQKVVRIPVEQEVIVPKTKGIKSQKRISKQEMDSRVNSVRKYLSENYGGYTSVKATGGYVLKSGKVVKEPVVEVTSFASKSDYKKHKSQTNKQLFGWGKSWKQESVGYVKEGDLYLYYPKQRVKKQ